MTTTGDVIGHSMLQGLDISDFNQICSRVITALTDFMFILEQALAVTFGTLFMVTVGKVVGPGIWKPTCFTFTGIQMDVAIERQDGMDMLYDKDSSKTLKVP